MNKYKLIILDSAFYDLEIIFYFCKINYNIIYATKIINLLLKESFSLDIFPFANPIFYVTSQYVVRKKIVFKRYLIIYTIVKNYVFVFNIFDGRRNINPTDLFK